VNLIETLERRFGAVPGGKLPGTEVDEMVKVAVLEAFHKTDSDFLTKGNVDAGSTANTVLIMGRRVYSCNVGDSRTIISREQKLLLCSNDHKPAREDEARRIREAGGFIFQNRVMGELAVSRAFGDRELKKSMQEIMAPEELEQMSLRDAKSDGEEALVKDYSQPLVIARPEFLVSELTEKDDFVLLACDGLFDVFPNAEVVRFVLEEMRQHHDAQRACENLSYTAIHQRIAHDNVSIVLLVTNKWW
jgi:serine/threonine protein phosphatase PrpC